ncbi:MAG TPA: peptide deformylase [Bacteriovoracaceae bacterium]|nr:peptide deformylase [Bacteriovoracaceae bacterium]
MKIENYELKGTKLPIITYPDPVLTAVAQPVTEFGEPLKKLVEDMLFTMYHAPGIGLAAPQIGKSIRLFVIDINYEKETVTNAEGKAVTKFTDTQPMVFVNPIITGKSGTTTYEEGCLSVPGVYEEVKRFETINVKYQDLDGNEHTIDADDLLSICIQHENDHLDGIVFIERLSNLKKNFYKKKMIKEKAR